MPDDNVNKWEPSSPLTPTWGGTQDIKYLDQWDEKAKQRCVPS